MNNSQTDESELSDIHDEAEDESDSSSTSSEGSSGNTSSSSSSSSEEFSSISSSALSNDNQTEIVRITSKEVFNLPRGLCEYPAVFNEFFSMNTWNQLTEEQQNHLKGYLPNFNHVLEPNVAIEEQQRSLQLFFSGDLIRFGQTQLGQFQRNLEEGNYRPDVQILRTSIAKSRRREQRFQNCERLSYLAKQLFISRENLLRTAYKSAPDTILRLEKNVKRQQPSVLYGDTKLSAVRARKRFYKEFTQIKQRLGIKKDYLSADDENDPDSLTAEEWRHEAQLQQYITDEINTLKMGSSGQLLDKCIYGTMFKRRADLTDEEALRAEQCTKKARLSNRNLRQYLLDHKRRKVMEPNLLDFDTTDIRLRDVCSRAQIGGNFKRMFSTGKQPGRKPKQAKLSSEPPALVPITKRKIGDQDDKIKANIRDVSSAQSTPPALQFFSATKDYEKEQNSKMLTLHQNHHSNTEYNDNVYIPGDSETFGGIIDNEVEIQQVEVETEEHPRFIGTYGSLNDMELPHSEHLPEKVFQTPQKQNKSPISMAMSTGNHRLNLSSLDNLPKLEPIVPQISPKDRYNRKSSNIVSKRQAVPLKVGRSSSTDLLQDTHEGFFSVLRDLFCSTANHRLPLEELKKKIDHWLTNPITALNDWYGQVDSWQVHLKSALQFLTGQCEELPEDYVPYVEYKTQLNMYQWIGAGRDTDAHLMPLFKFWLQHKNASLNDPFESTIDGDISLEETPTIIADGNVSPPPPPRCPTKWTVRPATNEELITFQRQERERFKQPHRSYTYRMHGYESIVGPVRGIYTQIKAMTKAREHSMMVGDRPNFVTILTLVRDAIGRLPNGEGTRADISELLKCSQYINRDAAETVLQTIVSGALDRMHTEHDPCIRYDPRKKIWIYLHRNRSEEDFEKMHQQTQNLGKMKKTPARKPKVKDVTKMTPIEANRGVIASSNSVTTSTTTLVPVPALVPANSLSVGQNNQNGSLMLAKNSPPVPPLKYNIPPSQQQQKSLLKTTYSNVQRLDQRGLTKSINTQGKTVTNQLPVVVATSSGLQTVHMTNPTSHLSASSSNSPGLSATLGGKRVALNKPIIINQITQQIGTKTKVQKQQKPIEQQQKMFIPIDSCLTLNAAENINSKVTNEGNTGNIQTFLLDNSQQFTSEELIGNEQHSQQSVSPFKNIIRIVPTVSGQGGGAPVRNVLSGTPIITSLAAQGGLKQQSGDQKQISILTSTSPTTTNTIQTNSPTIVKMSPQAFASLQQKQGQHIIVKQSPTGQQQHQQQRVILAGTTAILTQPVQGGTTTSDSNLLNIQSIPQTVTGNKIQQQQVIFQNLSKQQQELKAIQGTPNQAFTIVPQGAITSQDGKAVTVMVSQSQTPARILKSNVTTTSQANLSAQQQGQFIALNTSGTIGRNTADNTPTATNIIQLSPQQNLVSSGGTHFTIVSPGRNIVSLAGASTTSVQRITTTQAGQNATPAQTVSTVTKNISGDTKQIGKGNIVTRTSGQIITNVGGNSRIGSTTAPFNLTNLQGKQVFISTKNATGKNAINVSPSQVQQLQTAGLIIGGQTVKLQSGINATTTGGQQLQTVILGNQVVRMQQLPQGQLVKNPVLLNTKTTPITTISNQTLSAVPGTTNTIVSNNNEALQNKTILVGTGGQPIRLQTSGSPQSQAKGVNTNRLVLAVQGGGGQVFLSPGFQGNAIKGLQNMKVVSLANVQHKKQQQTISTDVTDGTRDFGS